MLFGTLLLSKEKGSARKINDFSSPVVLWLLLLKYQEEDG